MGLSNIRLEASKTLATFANQSKLRCLFFSDFLQYDCDGLDLIRWVCEIILPVLILVFGLVSNITISIITIKNKFSDQGSQYCIFIIAITDSVWLVVNYLHHYVRKWGPVLGINLAYCKITGVLSYAATGCSYWLTVTMVTMRFFSVCRPIRARSFTTVKNIQIMTLAVVVVTLLAHTPFFVTERIDGNNVCYDQDSWFSTMISSIHFAVFMAIPFVWLIVVNTALSIKLRRRDSGHESCVETMVVPHDTEADMELTPTKATATLRQVSGGDKLLSVRLTVMIVVSSWLYALLTLPWYAQDIYYDIHSGVEKTDRHRAAINSITWTLSMLNYADNGILYCVMFTDFRRRVSRLFSGSISFDNIRTPV